MIREFPSSTVISYHPDHEGHATITKGLHARFRLIGGSVYWQNIFSQCADPTFLFLSILWHAVYAWDEALETLYAHISTLVSIIRLCSWSALPTLYFPGEEGCGYPRHRDHT